jgi:signal peptidase
MITTLLVVAAVGGWIFFAPQPLGGPVAYVVTDGISMQPGLHDGDLVLVRRADRYEVGDVAAYESESLGRVVLHRIIEVDGDRFVFQGDNNDFVDGEKPGIDQMVGKKWLMVPGAGKALAWLGHPRTAALLAGAIALILFSGLGLSRRKGRSVSAPAPSGPSAWPSWSWIPAAALALAVAAGAVAWLRPTSRPSSRQASYRLDGAFAYEANVEKTPAYPEGRVGTGDPVFLKLVDSLSVSFEQDFATREPHSVAGEASLTAVLSDSSGWRHVETIAPEREFDGDGVVLAGELDLRDLTTVVHRVQRITGVQEPYYTLTFQPDVSIAGTVGGKAIAERVGGSVAFQVDPLKMKLVAAEPGADGVARDPLHPTREGVVMVSESEPNALSVAGRSVPIVPARMAAIVAAVLSLLTLLFARRSGRAPVDEPTRISLAYKDWLIEGARDSGSPRKAVHVRSIEDLVRLAERYDRMILHDHSDGVHSYVVEEQGVAYWYQFVSPFASLGVPGGRATVHRLPPRPEGPRPQAPRPTGTSSHL